MPVLPSKIFMYRESSGQKTYSALFNPVRALMESLMVAGLTFRL